MGGRVCKLQVRSRSGKQFSALQDFWCHQCLPPHNLSASSLNARKLLGARRMSTGLWSLNQSINTFRACPENISGHQHPHTSTIVALPICPPWVTQYRSSNVTDRSTNKVKTAQYSRCQDSRIHFGLGITPEGWGCCLGSSNRAL